MFYFLNIIMLTKQKKNHFSQYPLWYQSSYDVPKLFSLGLTILTL